MTNFTPHNFKAHVHCEHPNNQIYRFNGFMSVTTTFSFELQIPDYPHIIFICLLVHFSLHKDRREPVNKNNLLLRGCEVKNTDFVEGIVVYAG